MEAIILTIIIATILNIYFLKQTQVKKVIQNTEIVAENNIARITLDQKQAELKEVEKQLANNQELLGKLSNTIETMRQTATKQAEEEYQANKLALEDSLEKYKKESLLAIEEEILKLKSLSEMESRKLKDLEDKQLAYIQAKQREQEIREKADYYRLIIPEEEKADIAQFRDLQKHLVKKDGVDKIIYETYYKPAYDILMSHIFGNASGSKISGIYKITDLETGLSYIGQSVDIRERFRQHIKAALTAYSGTNNKLYKAMQKSGLYNFTFEVLEQVSRDKLNEREIYWIDFYKTKEFGLNSQKGGGSIS